jgi:hypothetical protein
MAERTTMQPSEAFSTQLGFQSLEVNEEQVDKEYEGQGGSLREPVPLFAENKRIRPKMEELSSTQSDCSTSLPSNLYQEFKNEPVKGEIEHRSNADRERVDLQKRVPTNCIEDSDSVESKHNRGEVMVLRLLLGGKTNKNDGSVILPTPEAQDNQVTAAETNIGSPSRDKEKKQIEVQKGTAEREQSKPLRVETLKLLNVVVGRRVEEDYGEGDKIPCSTELKTLKKTSKRAVQAADFSIQADVKRHKARELTSVEVGEETISTLEREDAQNIDAMALKIEQKDDYKEELRDGGTPSLETETASGQPPRRTRRRRRKRPSGIDKNVLENIGPLDTSSMGEVPKQLSASASTSPAALGANIRSTDLLENSRNATLPISAEGPVAPVETLQTLISEVKSVPTVLNASPPIKREGVALTIAKTPINSLPSMSEEEWPSLANRHTATSLDFVPSSPLHERSEISSTQSKYSISKLVALSEVSDVVSPKKSEVLCSQNANSSNLQGKAAHASSLGNADRGNKQSEALTLASELHGNKIIEDSQQVPSRIDSKRKRKRSQKKRVSELGLQSVDQSNQNRPTGASPGTTKLNGTSASTPILHHSLPPRPQPTPNIQMSVLKRLHNATTMVAATPFRGAQARPPISSLRNWKSQHQRLKERHNNIIKTLRVLRCYCSPAVPWNFNQYVQYKNEIASEASRREKKKLAYLEKLQQDKKDEPTKWGEWVNEEVLSLWDDWKNSQNEATGQEAHRTMDLMPCMGGKIFLSRNSATLSQLTNWSPQEWFDNRLDFPGIHRFQTLKSAYWPQIPELRAAANERSTNPHAAALPAPKGSSFDWSLGSPTPFGKKHGEGAVMWTGMRGEEVPWQERARVYIPELDCVDGSGIKVERNLDQLETEWVGRALWEAIEE